MKKKMDFPSRRLHHEAGLAIGVILFVIALLAVIAVAMSASGTFTNSTITPDRIMADIKSQAQLIRSKILECYSYGYERGDLADKYPTSTGAGTLVEDLQCPSYTTGQENLWTGQSAAMLPPPTAGFDKWYYVNAASTGGGRCIRIQPNAGNASSIGVKNGLGQVATAFTANELVYDSGSASQRFIIWITRPTGTPSTDCGS
jgi:hypothetical protein